MAQGYRVNGGPSGGSQHGGGSKLRLAGKREVGLGSEGRSRWSWKPPGERPQFALPSSRGPENLSLPGLALVSLRTEDCRWRGVSVGLCRLRRLLTSE